LAIAGLVDSYVEKHTAGLRTAAEIKRRLHKDIVPVIGSVKVSELHRRDATRVVDAVTKRGAPTEAMRAFEDFGRNDGPVAGLVGIEGGVVSGVINLESPGV
jgi:hypothetical protein